MKRGHYYLAANARVASGMRQGLDAGPGLLPRLQHETIIDVFLSGSERGRLIDPTGDAFVLQLVADADLVGVVDKRAVLNAPTLRGIAVATETCYRIKDHGLGKVSRVNLLLPVTVFFFFY